MLSTLLARSLIGLSVFAAMFTAAYTQARITTAAAQESRAA